MKRVKTEGKLRSTRSGNTVSLFSPPDLKFDLRKGFPAVTTKKLQIERVIGELLWFLNGSTSLLELRKLSLLPEGAWTIWTQDQTRFASTATGIHKKLIEQEESIGNMYGHCWRNYGYTTDQITNLINNIKNNPTSRELLVINYNPSDRANCALMACHLFFQCYVDDGHLDLKFYMRSNDLFLGAPFNIASYAALMHIIGLITNLKPRYLTCSFGDAHIYEKHLEQVELQLSREPFELPKLYVSEILDTTSIDDFLLNATARHFRLLNYVCHDPIKAPLLTGN